MPRIGTIKNFFDGLFSVNRFDFLSGAGYLTLGIMAGYIYRNIPIRVECDHWTNFILDPYKVSYAHIALILVIIHAFNGFGKYVFRNVYGNSCHEPCPNVRRSCLRSRSTYKLYHQKRDFSEIVYTLVLVYVIPLFLLSLYYNYGYDYGCTGLHLIWPLIPLVPWLLTGQKSRELYDLSQGLTGFSTFILFIAQRATYALVAFAIHAFVFYFSRQRGMQFKRMSSPFFANLAIALSCWFLYVAMLQSCVDSRGDVNCYRWRPRDHCKILAETYPVGSTGGACQTLCSVFG